MASAAPAIDGLPQHMAALERANRVRIRRAEIKRQLSAGVRTLESALADEACATARVTDLLLALNRLGPVKCGKLLAELRLSPNKLAGALTDRQRGALLARVAGEPLPLWPADRPPAPAPVAEADASIEALLA